MYHYVIRRFYIIVLFLGACFLGACSGSGGSGSGNELGSEGAQPTDPGELPISGTARYDGFLTLGLPTPTGRQTFSGDLALTVDFDAAAAQVTGVADSFSTDDDDDVRGRIMITDGMIDRKAQTVSDYTFEAGLSGTLSGDAFRNLVISGTMLGDFNGEDADAVTGRVFGDLVGATGEDIFNGSFSAAKN